MTILKRISIILLALVVMFGMVAASFQPAAAAAETATTCSQWHTVVRGEYLTMIARMYNTDWRALAEINNLRNPNLIYPGQKLCVSLSRSGSTPVVIPDTGTGMRVYALSVEEDEYVTLRGRSLVTNTRYTVYMSKYGTYPTTAYLVGYAYTDKNGAFTATYSLPKKLVDVAKIGVNIYNGRGDAASNWFINATVEGNTGGIGAPALSFSIVAVKEGDYVKIKTSNLPANVTFEVLMGKEGSKGVKGTQVGTLRDEDGGSVKATFDIPSELQGRSKIDLRLENKKLGIFVYLTFTNKDKP